MKQYPEIPGSSKAPLGSPCLAFYKYDGSNLRWEWSPKRGWYKFGTRTQLFNATDPLYGQAIPIFLNQMGDEIVRRSKDLERGVQRVIVFTEFFGASSFAGKHDENESKLLRLIDVNLFKRGMMKPRLFNNSFGDLPWCAKLIYDGNMNKQFIEDVRKGHYPLHEGVVAKGVDGDWVVKIKTNAYMEKLVEIFNNDYRRYWE